MSFFYVCFFVFPIFCNVASGQIEANNAEGCMLPKNANYGDQNQIVSPGKIINVVCNHGYILSSQNRMMTCLDGGSWAESFRCIGVAGSCGRPESVENAILEPEYRNRERFSDGESMQYRCKIGYNLGGSSRERRCSNGQWSSTRFTCSLITCPYIPNPEHGRRLDQNNSAGEHTEFGCRNGYRLRGQRKLLCRTDGKWLPSSPPTCDPILCPELQRVKHGRAMFQDTSDGVRNNYESVAEYTCKSGYYPNGNRKMKTYKRTCQSDGRWDGKEPTCDVPRCEQISNYYGGEVTYFGDRKLYSQAFYRCDDAFSLYPNVDMSECEDTLRWTPDPPTCYKKAKVEVPKNGYSQRTNSDILLHLESYSVCCYKDYELKSDIYMEEKCTRIRNNNGTLVPKVPECVEARCDPYGQYKANVRYENGSKVVTKFPSRTDVYLSCKDGYDYYRGDKPMRTPLKRTCVKGKIKHGPTCQEARCLFSGYPSNEHTFHRIYLSDARLVAEDQYIHSRQTIEVFCSNKIEYELYVNTTRAYPEEFTSECKMGQFDMKKIDFPICLEKRCEPASLYKAVAKDNDGQRVKMKIPSGTIVDLSCEAGYDYYSNGRPMNKPIVRQCAKGTIINAPKCEEKKCLFSGYPSNSDTYHTSEGRTVVADSYIDHNSKIAVKCPEKEGYELYVNSTQTYERKFTSECRYGVMNKKRAEFPICLEKRCSVDVSSKEVCLWTDEVSVCKANEFQIPSGSMVHMRCKDESNLRRLQDGSYVEVNGSGSIHCYKGDYSKNYKCIPDGLFNKVVHLAKELKYEVVDTIDRFTCRFSIFGFQSCKDPCLIPNIPFGFAKRIPSDEKIEHEAARGTTIAVVCDFGYSPSSEMTATCKYGEWDNQLPSCVPQPCKLRLNNGTSFWVDKRLLSKEDGKTQIFDNGTKLQIQCNKDYKMKDMQSKVIVENRLRYSTCVLGDWTHKYKCIPEGCSVPKVDHASLRSKASSNYEHMEKITFICDAGFHFEQTTSKTVTKFETICNLGNWTNNIPQGCKSDGCKLDILEGSKYFINGTNVPVTNAGLKKHLTVVQLKCMDTFDLFDDKNNIFKDKTYIPTVTCYQGKWLNKHFCKKTHTEIPDAIDENQSQNESEKGCTLSDDLRYRFIDYDYVVKPPGSKISDGTSLRVECASLDLYSDYNYNFDYWNDTDQTITYDRAANYDTWNDTYSTSDQTVKCVGNLLSPFELDCPEVEEDTCMELQDGTVKKENVYYIVSCNKGYSLNLIIPEKPQCTCANGTLKSVFGHQKPACTPDDCVVPYEIDDRLSVTDKNFVSLSGGSVVEIGDFVYFNCSKVGEQKYEPLNRRFRCSNGLWVEAERDPNNWSFGNNGDFPVCREAICKPNCTNGGVCYKDNGCRCGHLTEGSRCEQVICDNSCLQNGGTCDSPGICTCPAGRYGSNCEHKGCIFPKHAAKYRYNRTNFEIDETLTTFVCDPGSIISSQNGMTCLKDGTWSEIVTCENAVYYLIRVKTGRWVYAGTNANVYITLHGKKGKTDKIYLWGSFEYNDLDETRRRARDIRPIERVVIGHDGRGAGSDWYMEYASIYVEDMEEYYVFRHNDWVGEENDVSLPRQELQQNCIDSFDDGNKWWPDWQRIRHYDIGRGKQISPRECKQRCITQTEIQCVSVQYSKKRRSCWGLTVSDKSYFVKVDESTSSWVYLRTCKRFN